jgi:hypothetical protein
MKKLALEPFDSKAMTEFLFVDFRLIEIGVYSSAKCTFRDIIREKLQPTGKPPKVRNRATLLLFLDKTMFFLCDSNVISLWGM